MSIIINICVLSDTRYACMYIEYRREMLWKAKQKKFFLAAEGAFWLHTQKKMRAKISERDPSIIIHGPITLIDK